MAVKNKYNPTQEEEEFFNYSEEIIEEKPGIPWYKSYPSALGRGLIKGIADFGEMVSPAAPPSQIQQGKEQREEALDELLPIGEGFGPKATERVAKLAPITIGTGGRNIVGSALRTGAAGLLGQGAEEAGIGEMGQAIAELIPLLGPNLSREIPLRQGQRELGEYARRMGLTEEQLGLALEKEGISTDFLTNIATKGNRTHNRFQRTREALGGVWNTLRQSPEAQQRLSRPGQNNMVTALSDIMSDIPAAQRNLITEDFNDLIGSNFSGEDLINFWQDLNYYINRGERGLGRLKEPIRQGIQNIDPGLSRDFALTNRLYGNFGEFAQRMAPNVAEQLLTSGESALLLSGITRGDVGLLKKVLGPVGGRLLANQMITNPRFQNMSQRMIRALNDRSLPLAKKVYDQMILEVGKRSSEAAHKLSGFDTEEFFENLPEEKSSRDK